MVLRIGHRGAAGYADENTLESVKKAIALNCDMIELDVRKCSTGELVLMHDKSVTRITGCRGFVSSMPYDKLKQLRTTSGYKIPLLDDVLRLVKGRCKLNIEMKDKTSYKEIIGLVEKYNLEDDVIISSYYSDLVEQVRMINPKIRTALLSKHHFGLIKKAKNIGCYSIHPHYFIRLTKNFVKKAHANGLKVFVWTVDSQKEINRLKAIEADGVMSNYPDRV